ncbi:MAG: type II toxin-antitoxin system VapC family toxin [bacterium]
MRVLIDTNAYTALLTGDDRIARVLDESDAVLLSSIVLGELYDGFLGGGRNEDNLRILARFREKPRTAVVPVSDTTAEWFAHLKQLLRRNGTPIPINDVWIAASCMEHGAALISYDTHFAAIEGLLVRPAR